MKDYQSFESIYIKYYPVLLVYGKNISNDETLIEDVIQELFLTLWKKRQTLVFQASLDRYLFVAFRNNLIRKMKATVTEEIKREIVDHPSSETSQPIDKKLKDLINQLPPRQKEVLFLRYYQNKSYGEIAEILNISYQVARNFSYRALKFLKKNMKNIYCVLISAAV